MEGRLIRNQKNGLKLLAGGYGYLRSATNVTSQNWRCSKYKSEKCKGSVSTRIPKTDDETIEVIAKNDHNHVPDPAHQEIEAAVSTMKARSVATTAAVPRRILSETLIGLSQEAQARAPKRKALAARIRRKRRREEEYDPEPANADFLVPEKYQVAKHGENNVRFLLHDDIENVEDEDDNEDHLPRIIVFASDRMLQILQESTTWIMDGTFKVAPRLVFQLYTIHAVVQRGTGTETYPCVYALLPNKTTETYVRLLNVVRNAQPMQATPTMIMIDFENASKAAVNQVFPNATVSGCFFHLCQSLWRNIQSNGLVPLYTEDQEARKILKQLPALAFLPIDDVIHGFDTIDEELAEPEYEEQIRQIFNYFEDVYIGRCGRRG